MDRVLRQFGHDGTLGNRAAPSGSAARGAGAAQEVGEKPRTEDVEVRVSDQALADATAVRTRKGKGSSLDQGTSFSDLCMRF